MSLVSYPYGSESVTIQAILEHYPEHLRTSSVKEYLDSVQPLVVRVDDDVFLFELLAAGVAKGHFFCSSKGKIALKNGKEALSSAMNELRVVIGLTPLGNKAARWFARKLGFVSNGILDGADGPIEFFSMTHKEWENKHGRTIR